MARKTRDAGLLVLALYLILDGLTRIVELHFTGLPIVLGAFALVAGVLLLLRK